MKAKKARKSKPLHVSYAFVVDGDTHTKQTSAYYETCIPVVKEIQKHNDFKDYAKTELYYKAANNDIYIKLKAFQQTALANAAALPIFDTANYKQGISEMHILFKELGLCDNTFKLITAS